ncbi:MAG TPA: 3'(2'),5'-bisphosphate nucleotidase CysQ [Xanthobacteraceae bacterium]|nr:3'(2'),5'-bisphosphate nucleotidase CysQ [Xanthobacteraceae bacterium]
MPAVDLAIVALIEPLTAIGVSAAAAIRSVRRQDGMRIKADGSPVTAADEAAEAVIRDGLTRLAPDLPIISEEHAAREQTVIKGANYFLVDPLDGTRDFIAGYEDYTVNIAIVSGGSPILGVVAAPATGTIWRGIVGRGAEQLTFSADRLSPPQPIHARARPPDELIVMVSRSHLDDATKTYLDGLPRSRRIACGSSLKFCRLAEGSADHYPRLSPTHDWDIAAGHAVLAAAGGSVIQPDGAPPRYGTPRREIPAFLAWGGPAPIDGAVTSG